MSLPVGTTTHMKKAHNSTCAKDGGADQEITLMPPVSEEYRNNYDSIFRTTPVVPVEVVSDIPPNCKPTQ